MVPQPETAEALRLKLQETEALVRDLYHGNITRAEFNVGARAYLEKVRAECPVPIRQLSVTHLVHLHRQTLTAINTAAMRAGVTVNEMMNQLVREGLENRAQRERRRMERERHVA